MRSGSASSILGCMHPWTTARPPPFLPCRFWCIWKAPFPLQGWPCLLPSFLPPRGCPWPLCLYRQALHPHSPGRMQLAAGACEGCRWTVSSAGPNGPLPAAEAGPPGDRRLHPQNSQIPLVCPPSALPAQTSSSLAYAASVLHPYQFRKNSEPKC